jgi:hypothetical protein
MKKNVLFAAAVLLFSVATQAQSPLSFGVQAGLNLSNVSWTGADDASSKIGFNIGVTADYGLADALYLQPALLYTVKGASDVAGDDVSASLSYLELPINLAYKIPVTEGCTVVLKAGPYLAYGLSAKLSGEEGGVSAEIDLYKENEDIWGTDDAPLKKLDYGIGIGAGIEFGQIVAGLSYEMGLANLANYDGGKIKNQNAFLSVGYKF